MICVDAGFFMNFYTDTGRAGDSAFLESRVLHPKRNLQCLQFFYKMTGSSKDKLVVWTRKEVAKGKVLSPTAAGNFTGRLEKTGEQPCSII